MKVFVIAWTNVQRTLRDRMGLFFIVVLPLILIVVLGMTYGGMGAVRIGAYAGAGSGELASALLDDLADGSRRIDVRRYGTADEVRKAVEGGYLELGVVLPDDYDEVLRDGGTASLDYVAQPESIAGVARTTVDEVIAAQASLIRAARVTADLTGVTFDDALASAREAAPDVQGVDVVTDRVGEVQAEASGFTLGAQSQVVLFMFLTSMTGAVPLVISRRLGVSRRMLSTPTSARTIIAGETLGRFVFALFQGGFIVVASGLVFGVDWVDPVATGLIVVAFALVACGAAMLIASTASNESQVSAFGAGLGMLFGLIGGAMVPVEVFPTIMQSLSRVTPHAWAMDAFHTLLRDGPGVAAILPQVGVLLAFAAGLLALAVWRFQRTLVSGH